MGLRAVTARLGEADSNIRLSAGIVFKVDVAAPEVRRSLRRSHGHEGRLVLVATRSMAI